MRIRLIVACASLLAGCVSYDRPAYSPVIAQQDAPVEVKPKEQAPEPIIDPVPSGVECDDVVINDHRIRDEVATLKQEALRVDKRLVEGGAISCRVDSSFSNPKAYELSRVESGVYEGILYRIHYVDGSGTIQGDPSSTLDFIKDLRLKNWGVKCYVDQIEDSKWCSLSKEDLTVGVWKDGSAFVHIGSSHYPRSSITVRTDKKQPISANESTGFSGSQARQIINELKSGEAAVTRYQEWPYQSNLDKKVDLFGFDEAWSLLNIVYQNIYVN